MASSRGLIVKSAISRTSIGDAVFDVTAISRIWPMIELMGPWQALATAMRGSGECAVVDRILGVSIPMWALLWFVALALFALVAAFRRRAVHRSGVDAVA